MWKTFLLPVLFLFAYQFGYSQNDNDIRLANEYYTKGEVEKAKILYEQIAHDLNKIPQIHNNYFYLLLSTNDFKTAEKYIERLIKKFSGNLYYRLDMGLLYKAENKESTADKYFKSIIDEIATNAYLVRHASNYFVTNQLHDYSVLAFAKSRLVLQNPYLYSLELANLHRILGNRDKMVEEYLNYITSNPSNIRYVKNTLQNLLTETEELESLENLLYSKIQDDPSNTVYPELLIWVNLQQKNFYGAYIQARAIDKRLQQEGNNSIDIGIIALDNGDFKTASVIFSWIVENFQGTQNYYKARMYLIQSYEMRVKNSYPVNTVEIRKIINDYQKLINELGTDKSSLDAMRNKAILHAFYMDEKDSAIAILNKVINAPIGNVTVKSQSKLDLGDIYLLQGEFWESTLLYSQVEKERKESPLAYEAKLKNAKLSYYRGDFLLAQEHLDIIKEATTREIANDAMDLSLLIKENSAFDSTEMAMKRYASIDLLLFQNKEEDVLNEIDKMKKEFPFHSLTDELLWMEAKIYLQKAQFDIAVEKLEKIIQVYPEDILGDDAFFLLAETYEINIKDKEKAMDLYLKFLSQYPGSVYAAESRKRFRMLRGDFEINKIN